MAAVNLIIGSIAQENTRVNGAQPQGGQAEIGKLRAERNTLDGRTAGAVRLSVFRLLLSAFPAPQFPQEVF
jgi:hypothetical protein